MPELTKTEILNCAPSSDLPAETSAILRIFGRNTLWLWLDLGALRIGTALAGLFLIRYFGPANFGIYSTALAVGWILNAVIDLGLTRYTARASAADPSQVSGILALSLFSTGVFAALSLVVAVVAARLGYWQAACLAAGFILCNFEGTASLCSSTLTARLRSRAILPGSVLGAAGLIALTCLAIWLRWSVLTMLLALSCKSLLVLLLRLWQLREFFPGLADWTWGQYRRATRNALPYFAYNLTQVGYGKIAILCLGFVATQENVGWFAAAFTLSDVIPQWSYSLSGAILPLWTRLFESGRIEEMLSLRQRLMDIILFASVPIWITLALFAPEFCSLLGPKYLAGAPVLRVLAFRSVLSVLDGFLGHGFLVAINRVKERQSALARCTLLLTALSLPFGYFWGALGVAAALLVSDACLILQYLVIASRIELRIEVLPVVPVLCAGAAMATGAWALPSGVTAVSKIILSALIYFCALFLLSRRQLVDAGRTLRECVN